MYRRLAIAALVVLCGLVVAALAGCAAEPKVDVAHAGVRTADAGSSRVAVTATLEGETLLGGRLDVRGQGVIDARSGRARLSLEMPSPAPIVAADDVRIEEVFDGSTIYARGGIFDRMLPPGRRWVEIDVERLLERQGVDANGLSTLTRDPHEVLDLLRATDDEVEEVDTEEVRGVPTTQLRGAIDLGRYPDLVPPRERYDAAARAAALKKLVGTSRLPVDVWVGDDGLVRRMRQRLPPGGLDGGPRLSTTVELELYDFGVDADIELPRAHDTVSFEQIGLPLGPPNGGPLPEIDLSPGSISECRFDPGDELRTGC